jgi:hypothetical protein
MTCNGRQNTAYNSKGRATKNCTNYWMSIVFVWGEMFGNIREKMFVEEELNYKI